MQHIVKRQFIELTLDRGLDHFHIQQLVSSQYWTNIVPVLENAFDKIGNEEEVIQLDKLEIDLGLISVKSLEENEWGSRLQSKIETLLSSLTHPGSASRTVMSAPKRLNVFQQWFFYMQKGYLPWNTIQTDEHWYQLVLEALAVDFHSVQQLMHAIKKDRNILARIVIQHSDFFILKLTEIFTALKQDQLKEIIDELVILSEYLKQKAQSAALTEKRIRSAIWAKAVSIAATGNFTNANRTLHEELIALFLHENRIVKKIPPRIASKLRLTLVHIEKSREILKAILREEKGKFTKSIKNKDQKKEQNQISFIKENDADINYKKQSSIAEIETEEHLLTDASGLITERELDEMGISNIDEEGIFVANAGLVLLHPFLHSLFVRLNLTNEGKFIDKDRLQKALCILHYIATGNVEAEEHELAIGKILCAHPLEETVEKNIGISKEILRESNEMIVAAIQQWDKLAGTSPEGLREGFLQRTGKVSSRNGNMYLQVEQSAIDILLDYLPWNLGMIKLPWMKDILRVEWR